MSRKYEGIIILNTKGADGGVEEISNSITKEIQAEGGKASAVNDLGRRQFAYNSKHQETGHYISVPFTAEPAAIEKIQARLRLNENVYQQYFQRIA